MGDYEEMDSETSRRGIEIWRAGGCCMGLALSQAVRDRISDLREATGAESIAEVFRRALAVYDTLITAQKDGGQIFVRTKDGQEHSLVIKLSRPRAVDPDRRGPVVGPSGHQVANKTEDRWKA